MRVVINPEAEAALPEPLYDPETGQLIGHRRERGNPAPLRLIAAAHETAAAQKFHGDFEARLVT
jgi:hypothetical protein